MSTPTTDEMAESRTLDEIDENYLLRIDLWEDNTQLLGNKMACPRPVHHSLEELLESLECFVASRKGIQLGRNRPGSSPETYVSLRPTARPSLSAQSLRLPSSAEVPSTTGGSTVDEIRIDNITPDEFILRELADIRRLLLQRFLNQGDTLYHLDPNDEILDILGVLSAESDGTEITPHFPVGEWDFSECQVCLETRWLYRRICCAFPVCNDCLRRYFSTKVGEGVVKIECCNFTCHAFVHRDEVSARLDPTVKERFHRALASVNQDPLAKTCPRCNQVMKVTKLSVLKDMKKFPDKSRVVCGECQLIWCFTCHCPWHHGFTCKQFRKGDRLLKTWAQETHHGQRNAQRCPRCKIFIQRTSGCDHMHCSRCKSDFCYRCGDQLRKLKFFGDHYSKLSIFGCKYRYMADRPVQRKFVRGTVFVGKLLVAPVIGALGACAGVVAVGLGLFALPVCGGIKLYRRYEVKRHAIPRPIQEGGEHSRWIIR